MNRRIALGCERLEQRENPATTGITWPDGMHMTLSFVPDGTKVGEASSNLFAKLDAEASTATWQQEILEAFQTWAVNTNLNVGVVSDSGAPLGTAGAVQGDTRFGDIRIAAVPLPDGTLATNTPFLWSGSTWSGDVVLNSNYLFRTNYNGNQNGVFDLYTVMLNESGNVFGVLDTKTDKTSAVYNSYAGRKTGLNATDLADIQSLYGVREPDKIDATKGNNKITAAASLGNNNNHLVKEGDITTNTDVDFYTFTVPATSPAVVGVRVSVITEGVSSLQAGLKVYNSAQKLMTSQPANGPGQNLTYQIDNPAAYSQYYVSITGNNAGNSFHIGSYVLKVVYLYANGTTSEGNGNSSNTDMYVGDDNHTNDTIDVATNIPTRAGNKPDARFDFVYTGRLRDATDIDFYKVKAPSASGQKLNVVLWGLAPDAPAPKVEVFDAAYQPVAATLLSNQDGTFSVEVANVTGGCNYFIKVSALNPTGLRATGNYFMGADFNTQARTSFETYGSGTISPTNGTVSQTLTLNRNQLYDFQLAANAGPSGAWTQVRMEIVNASGEVVFVLDSYSGIPSATGQVYLRAGSYTVRYSAAASGNNALNPTDFTLRGRMISDPIGPTTVSSTSATTTTASWTPPTPSSGSSFLASWISPWYR